MFPAFADANTFYPDVTLQAYWDTAILYITDQTAGSRLITEAKQARAINLMTAHLAALSQIIAKGNIPGLVESATIDKVSVTMTPPPAKTQWQWWLSLTPYGQQLYALLQISSVGGFYFGGVPEIGAIRRTGGITG